jgi:hypothetical protein
MIMTAATVQPATVTPGDGTVLGYYALGSVEALTLVVGTLSAARDCLPRRCSHLPRRSLSSG